MIFFLLEPNWSHSMRLQCYILICGPTPPHCYLMLYQNIETQTINVATTFMAKCEAQTKKREVSMFCKSQAGNVASNFGQFSCSHASNRVAYKNVMNRNDDGTKFHFTPKNNICNIIILNKYGREIKIFLRTIYVKKYTLLKHVYSTYLSYSYFMYRFLIVTSRSN